MLVITRLSIGCFLVYILMFFITSCSAANPNKMKISENRYNKRIDEKLLINMPLNTLFENDEVRKLAKAAGDGDTELVKALVQSGTDVNARGNGNATPLFWAMKNFEGFKTLLELGADPNIIFDDGGNVVHWSMKMQDSRFLNEALSHNGDPNLIAGMMQYSPAFMIYGSKTKLEILIAHDVDLNLRSQFKNPFTGEYVGDTPLINAARTNDFDTVYMLLKAGADYTIKNNEGISLIDKLNDAKFKLDPSSEQYLKLEKVFTWLNSQK